MIILGFSLFGYQLFSTFFIDIFAKILFPQFFRQCFKYFTNQPKNDNRKVTSQVANTDQWPYVYHRKPSKSHFLDLGVDVGERWRSDGSLAIKRHHYYF